MPINRAFVTVVAVVTLKQTFLLKTEVLGGVDQTPPPSQSLCTRAIEAPRVRMLGVFAKFLKKIATIR